MKTYIFTSRIDQGIKVEKHITLETKMAFAIHLINIPLQILFSTMKSHTNTSCNWTNFIKEWTTSKSGIMVFNPSNVFT
jgi:hypothetical protein